MDDGPAGRKYGNLIKAESKIIVFVIQKVEASSILSLPE